MKEITLTITPEVNSRWKWSARLRWGLAAAASRMAGLWIDVAVMLSDDIDIAVKTKKEGRWSE